MSIVIEIILLITSLLFTFIICIASVNKKIIWSYILFDDEEDYEDYGDDDLDEYYEQYFYLRVRNPFQFSSHDPITFVLLNKKGNEI